MKRMSRFRHPHESTEESPVAAMPDVTVPPSFPSIWAVIAAIPVGSVASYGEVARRAQLPRRARLVAQALRAAPSDMALPWFRVIRSDGRIAFAPGTTSFRRQRRLLAREGTVVLDNGRVNAAKPVADEDDLDAALWRS